MIFNLNINKVSDFKLKFRLCFKNDDMTSVFLPITSFDNSGQAVGINMLAGSKKIKPVRQASTYLIDPTANDKNLSIGESIFIDWDAEIKKFGDHWGLEFDKVTFLLEPNTTYKIFVHWDKYKSNEVEWIFNKPI